MPTTPIINGRLSAAKRARIDRTLARLNRGSDDVDIADGSHEDAEEEFSTMADAARFVQGTKWLCRGYIPFGLLTGLISEPGRGKSALALWIARTVLLKTKWFTGKRGLPRPRKVLWCSTENDTGITIERCNAWNIPLDNLVLPFEDPLQSQ